MQQEVWYRIEDVRVSCGVDEFDNSLGSYVTLRRYAYPVVKHTKKGAWLDIGSRKRFVLRDCTKRWAAPTHELALQSFVARKKKQARIYLARAEQALRAQKHAMDIEKADSWSRHTYQGLPYRSF